MKFRIMDALKKIAANNVSAAVLIEVLSRELKISPLELSSRATLLLSEILHNYSDFAISTIDSFTHKIVKTFAYDLKLPVNFNIETNTGDFYQKVISGLLSKIGEDTALTNLLVQYASNNASENTSWDPESKLIEFINLLQKENADAYLQKLKILSTDELKAFQKKLYAHTSSFKKNIKEAGKKGVELIKKNKLNDKHFHYTKSGPHRIFFKWAKISNEKTGDLISSRITEAIANNKWGNNSNSADETQRVQSIAPALTTLANQTIEYISKNGDTYNLYSLIEKNIYSIILVNELQQISEEFRAEEQIVFISEFNSKIATIVSEEPAPFIYERLGERYQHYLLDEFQDTSTLQWMNLLPLIDNSLSQGKFNLIVGDGKQSIYRWRNANVQQFNSLPDLNNEQNNPVIEERKENLIRNFEAKILDTNYRSLKQIIEFNNLVFDFLPKKILSENYRSIYDFQTQKIKKDKGGYVSIYYGDIEKDLLEEHNFNTTKQHIQNAIISGFDYKDICVIVRSNHQGNAIANFLIDNAIPVISSDSLLLKNNSEVNCIIAFLNYLNNPLDFVSAASVINYCIKDSLALAKALSSLNKSKNLFSVLNTNNYTIQFDDFSQKNVFDVCVHIITSLNLQKHNPQYIRFFLDEVNDYLVNKTGSVNDFLIWWDKRQDQASLIIPEGVNSVKIMTIHKSKGLEFPIVILPFFNWDVYKPSNAWVNLEKFNIELPVGVFNISKGISEAGLDDVYETEKNEQNLDNLNLIYVAFTRAVERLHIISNKSKTQKKETISLWINSFIESIKQNNNTGFIEFGSPADKLLPEHKEQPDSFDISNVNFNTNAGLVKIKGSHKLKVTDESEKALANGIKMHYILSEINSANEISIVLEKMSSNGIISDSEKETLCKKINSILKNNTIRNYYSGNYKTKNEAEIITETGEILRPDKVIFDNETVIIIDYKTGLPDVKKHSKQMQKYSDALQDMGVKNIKKILIYLDESLIEELQ